MTTGAAGFFVDGVCTIEIGREILGKWVPGAADVSREISWKYAENSVLQNLFDWKKEQGQI